MGEKVEAEAVTFTLRSSEEGLSACMQRAQGGGQALGAEHLCSLLFLCSVVSLKESMKH